MTISTASINAYHNIPDLDVRERRVLAVLTQYPNSSYRDVARIGKIDPEDVRRRMSDLNTKGEIVSNGKKRDRITKRVVTVYVTLEQSKTIAPFETEMIS